jgi:(R)-2-hydroxyacyl-CoA dehydratese activating ATPase
MPFVAGCDVGSLTSKAVIMKNGKIVADAIIKSRARPGDSAEEVMGEVLDRANLAQKDIVYCIGTGYGRDKIDFVDEVCRKSHATVKGPAGSCRQCRR